MSIKTVKETARDIPRTVRLFWTEAAAPALRSPRTLIESTVIGETALALPARTRTYLEDAPFAVAEKLEAASDKLRILSMRSRKLGEKRKYKNAADRTAHYQPIPKEKPQSAEHLAQSLAEYHMPADADRTV